jgi:hypothetical protein
MNTIDLENFSRKYIAKQPTEYVPSQGSFQIRFKKQRAIPTIPFKTISLGLAVLSQLLASGMP